MAQGQRDMDAGLVDTQDNFGILVDEYQPMALIDSEAA